MAVGKTSTARDFISRGNFNVMQMKIGRRSYPYLYDEQKSIVVTGRYDTRECGGLDGIIKNRAIMTEYLSKIARIVSPKVIVFEAVMYGMTVKFAKEISVMLNRYGYEYIGIQLAPPLETAIDNVFRRNGGKEINLEKFCEKYDRSISASKELKEAGYNIQFIDTSKYQKTDLHNIIQRVIDENSR